MNRKQKSWILVFFIITLLVGLVLELPAAQLFRVIQPPTELRIVGVNGSIISGRIETIEYQEYGLDNIQYDVQLGCLFKASLCIQLVSMDQPFSLQVERNLITQNVSIYDSQIQVDSTLIGSIPDMLVKPSGLFMLDVQKMTLVNLRLTDIQATIDWKDAGIEGEDQVLGNYSALISRHKDVLKVNLSDRDSLLSVSGEANLKLNGQYDIELQLGSRQGLNTSIISVLDMTAKKTGLNRFSIKRSGNSPPNISRLLQYVQPQG